MTKQVKYYNSMIHTGLGTWTPNTANSILTMLRLMFTNGFNAIGTVSSLTKSGTTATLTASGSHNYVTGQVVLIAGATGGDSALYNGEHVITVTSSTAFTFTMTGIPASNATGTITCKIAPLGWSEVYTGTNKAVFQSQNPISNQLYYRMREEAMTVSKDQYGVANAGTANCKVIEVLAYESMSSVDAGVSNLLAGYIMKGRAGTSNAGAYHCIVIGDDMSAWVFLQNEAQTAGNGCYWICTFVGDIIPAFSGDGYTGALCSAVGVGSSSTDMTAQQGASDISVPAAVSWPSYPSWYMSKNYSATVNGERVLSCGLTFYAASKTGAGFSQFNTVDKSTWAFPMYLWGSGGFRGLQPGNYNMGWATLDTSLYFQTVNNVSINGTLRSLLNLKDSSSSAITLDITGPWR